jgi:hypothetical protein
MAGKKPGHDFKGSNVVRKRAEGGILRSFPGASAMGDAKAERFARFAAA